MKYKIRNKQTSSHIPGPKSTVLNKVGIVPHSRTRSTAGFTVNKMTLSFPKTFSNKSCKYFI